jgi:hypothetical protein
MGEGQRNCYSRGKNKKAEILKTNERVVAKLKVKEGIEVGERENEGWKEIKDEENNKSDRNIIIIITTVCIIIYCAFNGAVSNSDHILCRMFG